MPTGLQGIEALSERQKEILRLVARQYQAKEIARLLRISEHTVKTHTDEARRRLEVPTSRQAARLLLEYEGVAGVPFDEPPPVSGMAQREGEASFSAHEQALSPPRPILDDQLSATGNSLGNAVGSRQIRPDTGLGGSRTPAEHVVQSNESLAHHAGDNGVVDGRWDGFRRRLKTLPTVQLLGVIVMAAILLAFLAGTLVATLLGMFEVVHKISTYSGWGP
jgi:DNA-binding CsgD family transcriptional regulator